MEINWIRSIGSALGAVSSAVLLSTLGVGGTLIGAAIGSLVITVGGTLYSRSLEATKERVVQTTARANRSLNRADGPARGASEDLPQEDFAQEDSAPEDAPAPPTQEEDSSASSSWMRTLSNLPWKRIVGGAVALFAVAMALILAFELAAGRSVSSFTGGSSETEGGTSIPGFDGFDDSDTDNDLVPQQGETTGVPQQEESTQAPQLQDEPTQAPQQQDEPTQAPQAPQPQEEAPQAPQAPAQPANPEG